MKITGTIKYISLEGGFWGIISNSGQQFLPVNLPISFQVHGTPITCNYKQANHMDSFINWGERIQIISFE